MKIYFEILFSRYYRWLTTVWREEPTAVCMEIHCIRLTMVYLTLRLILRTPILFKNLW